jgi:hypothetical protein
VTEGATSCTIGGLDNGIAYTFSIRAFTEYGASGPSTSSSPVSPRPRADESPAVSFAFETLTSLRVFWAPVESAQVDGYRVELMERLAPYDVFDSIDVDAQVLTTLFEDVDRDRQFMVRVTALDLEEDPITTISAYSGRSQIPKMRLSPMTIIGSAVVGQTLNASIRDWVPAASTESLQWLVNGVAIRGATGETYTLRSEDAGKRISVRVTGSRTGFGATTVTSPLTAAVLTGWPFDSSPIPTISGSAVLGQTLTASLGVWSPTLEPTEVSYQWLRNGSVIRRATGSTYLLTSSDVGRQISVRVVASKASYVSTTRESTRTSTVLAR